MSRDEAERPVQKVQKDMSRKTWIERETGKKWKTTREVEKQRKGKVQRDWENERARENMGKQKEEEELRIRYEVRCERGWEVAACWLDAYLSPIPLL